MRRVGLLLGLALVSRAHATPWSVTAEAGVEEDTNVQRVESGASIDPPISAVSTPLLRFGVRGDKRDTLAGGAYSLHLADLTRIVADRDVSVEDVTLLAGDLRWVHPIGERPVAAGFDVSVIDAFPLDDDYGARTFRNLAADFVINAHSGDDYRFNLGFGARSFRYKPPTSPSHLYNWTGPAADARLDLTLWQPADHTRSLELASTLGFEARGYEVGAIANACAPNAPPAPNCTASTSQPRSDRAARIGVELTYAGSYVATLGYQLTVLDSNSYGQSFARHRVLASGTISIGKTYLSLLAILQIDQYLDGLLVEADLQHQEFTNIEDENRSSAQFHISRKVSDEWSVEGRVAYWRNILGNTDDLSFSRAVFYAGVIYAK